MSHPEVCRVRVDATVHVDLDGTRHRLRWPSDKTLVDVLLEAGLDVPHSCREGRCGSCVGTVVSGAVDMGAGMDAGAVLQPDDLAEGLILGCQAHPASAELHIEY
ncbi:2Fe-2S iron-sulfur cluster-binding protein [Mycolicibacterium pulveris]|uniref:2Fe-2S iron-sulfur cluster-binding protein n=1 Tax=Mycolicibacterium pulveris TaxID=36813 RepID=UPI003CF3D806